MFKRKVVKARAQGTSLTPMQVAKAYGFPSGQNLQNQLICVIELGGSQTHLDITTYCKSMGVKAPVLKDVGVDGAWNNIFTPNPTGADGEVALDQCVIAAVAPGVQITTIYAPNSNQGFVDAINKAVSLKPCAISISWGSFEGSWDKASMDAMDAAMKAANEAGIAVYVAAGDNGSDDGVGDGNNHVDYPASSPYATACGGTQLLLNADGTRAAETVWGSPGDGATGGGFSTIYPPLSLQSKSLPGRSVPDVAGNADPISGYQIKVDFMGMAVGGTSAVAPLYSALHAILQSYFSEPLGDLKDVFYNLEPGEVFDVVSGSNGAFSANAGFDQCSGVGVVNGTAIIEAIKRVRKINS